MEDLPFYLKDEHGVRIDDIIINHIFQADDLTLISETRDGLQKLINGLEKFCQRWQIEINLEKTKIMIKTKNNDIQ